MEKSVKNYILEKIKKGELKKIPRFIFKLKAGLFWSAIVAIFLATLFLVSFILFILQASGLWNLPSVGSKGLQLLISNFPWLLTMLTIVLIVILEILINRYRFSYKRPLLYSILGIIFIALLGSFFAWQASLQERIYQNFKGDKFIQAFYNGYINPAPDEFHPGTVLEMNYDGFVLEQGDKTTINVKISKTTQTPQGFKIYKGGRLLVIGKIEDGVIDAEAIDNAPLSGRP